VPLRSAEAGFGRAMVTLPPAAAARYPSAPDPADRAGLSSPEDSAALMFKPVMHFLERFGNVVGRLLMTVVYVVVVMPVALCYRLFADPLLIRREPGSTYRAWSSINETVDDARRQD